MTWPESSTRPGTAAPTVCGGAPGRCRPADIDADQDPFHGGGASLGACAIAARDEARPTAAPIAAPRAAPASTSVGQCLAAQTRSTAAVTVIAVPSAGMTKH